MSYPNLPKSEYFQGFSAFRSCKASAFLHPQYQKSNKNLSLYRSKIFYRTYFWSIEAKTQLILYGFASILTKSERKSVYKKHGSDNSFHPKGKKIKYIADVKQFNPINCNRQLVGFCFTLHLTFIVSLCALVPFIVALSN